MEARRGGTSCWLRDDGEHAMWNLQKRTRKLARQDGRKFRIKLLDRCL
jgi:hypothetical protein